MKNNYRLIVLSKKWNRNLKKPGPGYWECTNKQIFEIKGKTITGAKRIATRHIFNDCEVPEQRLKHPVWWSRWKLSEDSVPYRISSIGFNTHMRAELIAEEP